MDDIPRWIPFLFGSVMMLMGTLILGALFEVVPVDEDGQFLAPSLVTFSLGLGLTSGGLLFWLPLQTPPRLRTFLALVVMVFMLVVCNWTAFAPNVVYHSSSSIGPLEVSGKAGIGGRIVFGIAALIVNSIFLSTIIAWLREIFRSPR